MKRSFRLRRASMVGIASTTAIMTAMCGQARAETWNQTAAGTTYSWGDAANWDTATVPSAVGATANLNNPILGAQTVSLNGGKTVGVLNLGSTSFAITLAPGTGGPLTLDNTTGSAQLNVGGSAANVISTTVALTDPLALNHAGTGSLTISGVMSGGGTLTKSGSGNLILSAANTFTGATTINAGTLTLGAAAPSGAAGALGNAASTVNLGNSSGALDASLLTSGAFTIARTITVRSGNTGVMTIGGSGANASIYSGTVTLDKSVSLTAIAGGTSTFSGVISGAGGITKIGAGTVVLSNAVNTYSGGTTISAGVLQANSSGALSAGAISVPAGSTGRLAVNGGVTLPTANSLTIGTGVTGLAGVGVLTTSGTGRGTFNGNINVLAQPTAGGVFASVNNTVGNELVINGAINGTTNVGMSQRDGRVIYAGGGNITGGFLVTGTAIVGAINGIPIGLTPTLGGAAAGTLDLASEGFNQELPAINVGNAAAGNSNAGSINLGSRTLTLNGNLTSISTATATVTHTVSGTAGGSLNLLGSRNLVVPDTLAADDLVLSTLSLPGSGALTKTGAGGLVTRDVTIAGSLNVSAGLLATSSAGGPDSGSLNTNGLVFADGTTLRMKVGTGGDSITGGVVTSGGVTTVNLAQFGGALSTGVYNLINYTGSTPGLAAFSLSSLPGRAVGSLIDTGTAIALNVTANDKVVWDGTIDGNWNTTTANWITQTGATATNFIQGDEVIFADAPTGPGGSNVTIAANVTTSNVTFTNTAATPYTVTAATAVGISGSGGLSKTGNGIVTLRTANTYTGATNVNAGTLILDHDVTGNVVLSGSSVVNVAPGATLRLQRNDDLFTFNRAIAGSGTVEINPRVSGVGTTALGLGFTGANTAFSGNLRLLSPSTGTYRITNVTPANLGSASIEVQSGAQVFTAANQTYNNSLSLAGIGYADSAGNIGALRLDANSVWAGPVVVNGSARIGAHNTTATVSGNISGGDLTVNATNFNNNYTIILTGTNSYATTTIGGQNIQTAGTPSMRLNIGNGGTTGTLGLGPVTINGDGANGVLGFDRSDGYTLAAGQTITAANGAGTIANSISRTFIDVDTLGTGLNTNGNAITLGTAAVGGQIRVAQTRAGAIFNVNSAVTAGIFSTGSGQLGTTNLNSGAVATANQFRVALNGNAAGSVLNINSGSTLDAVTQLFVGEAANGSATVNQFAGSVATVGQQLRVGHFGTETSTYNMAGGTLTLTGASPNLTPSTSGAGAASATGDNNIEAALVPVITGGGIYLGIDGTGVFNHSGGTVTTNWIVLDNRGNTGIGTNMPDGIDRYNLSGTGELRLRSSWGMIARNTTTAVSFGGGSVVVDNTGTNSATSPVVVTTGANLTVPLDAPIDVVAATTTTLNTNGAGNGFSLPRDVTGTGTLNLTGGGTINVGSAAFQEISAGLSSSGPAANIVKNGVGTTLLSGSASGYTGNITVNAGRLNVPNNLGAGGITIATGAALGGEPVAVVNLTLNNNSTLFFNPNTPGAITTNTLTVDGLNLIDLTTTPTGSGPYTVINYTTLVGTPNFSAANSANYRSMPVINNTGSAITLDITGGKALTWSGATNGVWDINATTNFQDNTLAPDKFFSADTVTFSEGGANPAITLTGELAPFSVAVNSDTTNYSFTATTGNQIIGGTGLTKTGASTLTLTGDNAYRGLTSVGGGTVAINGPASIGDGTSLNKIAISGGGRLSMTAPMNLGASRDIAVGTGGGSLSFNAATSGTITVPGAISSAAGNTLTFHSNAAGTGTFALTGNNSGFLGNIVVDSLGTGVTTLQIANNNAAPTGGSITVNYPVGGPANSNNTLNLPGTTLPAGVTVNLTSFNNGTIGLRSQITSTGDAVVNGPITVAGNANSLSQLSLASGTLTLNGNITEGVGGQTGTLFLRGGGGTGIINGTINLPTSVVSKTDAGTWVINSTGNNWVSSILAVGTVRIGINDALPTGVGLTLGQNDGNAASLVLNGFSQTVGSLASLPTAPGANTTGKTITSATAATFTVNQATNTTYAGLLTGALSFNKSGGGSLSLAGGNTYSGVTTITGGTLAVNGTHVGGGSYTVNSGGTLAGSGSLTLLASATNQVLVQAGGTLAPGNSPGIVNILNSSPGTGAASTLSLANNSTLSVELNGLIAGTEYDRVNVTGTVDISGSRLAVAVGFTPQISDEFLIIQNDGGDAVTGTLFASVNGNPLVDQGGGVWSTPIADSSGAFYTVNYLGGDGNDVVLTGIPEPTSVAVLAMAGLGLLSRRRRKA